MAVDNKIMQNFSTVSPKLRLVGERTGTWGVNTTVVKMGNTGIVPISMCLKKLKSDLNCPASKSCDYNFASQTDLNQKKYQMI